MLFVDSSNSRRRRLGSDTRLEACCSHPLARRLAGVLSARAPAASAEGACSCNSGAGFGGRCPGDALAFLLALMTTEACVLGSHGTVVLSRLRRLTHPRLSGKKRPICSPWSFHLRGALQVARRCKGFWWVRSRALLFRGNVSRCAPLGSLPRPPHSSPLSLRWLIHSAGAPILGTAALDNSTSPALVHNAFVCGPIKLFVFAFLLFCYFRFLFKF